MPMVFHNNCGASHPRLSGHLSGATDLLTGAGKQAASAAAAAIEQAGVPRNNVSSLVNSFVDYVCKTNPSKTQMSLKATSLLSQLNLQGVANISVPQALMVSAELATLGVALSRGQLCTSVKTDAGSGGGNGGSGGGSDDKPKEDNTALLAVGAAILLVGGALLMKR